MGRPKRKDGLVTEHRELARLMVAAFEAGDHGEKVPWRAGKHWTYPLLADQTGSSVSSVRSYLNVGDPTRPGHINRFLEAFFGARPEHKAKRAAMQRAWHLAGGKKDVPGVRQRVFSDTAPVVILTPNNVEWDNTGNPLVPFTLRFRREKGLTFKFDAEEARDPVSIDIAVVKPLFSIRSRHWMPRQDTIFREKKHQHVDESDALEDAVWIKGPKHKGGVWIDGKPFEDEPKIAIEHKGGDQNGPITFAVSVPRTGGLHVALADGEGVGAVADDIIEAIFAEAFHKDAGGRLEVASATVTPDIAKRQE